MNKNRFIILLSFVFSATLLTACGSGESAPDSEGTPQGEQCSNPLPTSESSSLMNVNAQVFSYSSRVDHGDNTYDIVTIQSFQSPTYGGPTATGSYGLGGSNYRDCGLCVLGYKNCTDEGGCEKTFYADRGTVHITNFGPDKFEANFESLTLTEVTIESDYSSVPVEGGESWCLPDSGSVSADYVIKEAQPVCVPEGIGSGMGDNIADFSLTNCNGDPVNLHTGCGDTKALWIVATAGWCPACTQWMDTAVLPTYEAEAENGLDIFIVLGEDDFYGKPDAEDCANYAAKHDMDPAKVLLDHNGDFAWATLWSNVNPYIGDTVGLPWNAILRGSNMQYIYADTNTNGFDINTALGTLLAE